MENGDDETNSLTCFFSRVFYTIFSGLYLLELGIDGVGKDFTTGGGFALFFRMSLGGFAIGLFFGFGALLVMGLMDRRLTREENVVEVATVSYIVNALRNSRSLPGFSCTHASRFYLVSSLQWPTFATSQQIQFGVLRVLSRRSPWD